MVYPLEIMEGAPCTKTTAPRTATTRSGTGNKAYAKEDERVAHHKGDPT